MSLIAEDMVLYMRKPEVFCQESFGADMINTFSKVAGYKTNIRKSIIFLYTNNDHTEKEMTETVLLANASAKQNKSKQNQKTLG